VGGALRADLYGGDDVPLGGYCGGLDKLIRPSILLSEQAPPTPPKI
jgi:hypothetical protein